MKEFGNWLFEGNGQILLSVFLFLAGCYLMFIGSLFICKYLGWVNAT